MELSQNAALVIALAPVLLVGIAYLCHVLKASKKHNH